MLPASHCSVHIIFLIKLNYHRYFGTEAEEENRYSICYLCCYYNLFGMFNILRQKPKLIPFMSKAEL